jgi:hypothetical protein
LTGSPSGSPPPVKVSTAWITGRGRRLDLALAAVGRAAELLGPHGRVTHESYRNLLRDKEIGGTLPPFHFIDHARKAAGLSLEELIERACPSETGERPLRDFIGPDLSRAQLRWAIKNGRLRANPRGGRWFTTRVWVDDFLRRREAARAARRRAPRRLRGEAGATKPSPRPDRLLQRKPTP